MISLLFLCAVLFVTGPLKILPFALGAVLVLGTLVFAAGHLGPRHLPLGRSGPAYPEEPEAPATPAGTANQGGPGSRPAAPRYRRVA